MHTAWSFVLCTTCRSTVEELTDKMTSAGEIEKRFRNNPELFTLKKHEAAKSEA